MSVGWSGFGSESKWYIRAILRSPVRYLLEKPEAGGRRLADLATGEPGRDWQHGAYYENDTLADGKVKTADDATAVAL